MWKQVMVTWCWLVFAGECFNGRAKLFNLFRYNVTDSAKRKIVQL